MLAEGVIQLFNIHLLTRIGSVNNDGVGLNSELGRRVWDHDAILLRPYVSVVDEQLSM